MLDVATDTTQVAITFGSHIEMLEVDELSALRRRQFRECSVLLVDNLSFLAGTSKNATKIEFLHTFDALVAEGGQVVVTCDCHPRLAEDLMPELADRLLGGASGACSRRTRRPGSTCSRRRRPGPGRRSPRRSFSSWRATCAATSANWRGRSTACGTTPA